MINIDPSIREKIYRGGLKKTPIIKIGNQQIRNGDIKSANISLPFLNKEDKVFTLGTFVSDQLELQFQNVQNLNFNQPISVDIKIKDLTDSEAEEITIPIGSYNIETSPDDYYKNAKITALDNGTLLKAPFRNMRQYMYREYNEHDEVIREYFTAESLLKSLCDEYGLVLGTYPQTNKSAETEYIDNTLSGKQYASWVAEIMGGNLKISRTGVLNVVPIYGTSKTTINALQSKSFTKGETYTLTEVRYDNGIEEIHSPLTEHTNQNILSIRTDNIFMNGTPEHRQELIDNLANVLVGLEITSITTENFFDFTIDSGDIVTYSLGTRGSYNTYYSGSFSLNNMQGKVDVNIPTKNVEQTTNTIVPSLEEQVRSVRTIVNQQEATITTITKTVKDLDDDLKDNYATKGDFDTIERSIERIQRDTYTKTQVQEILRGVSEDGVVAEYLHAGSMTFDINGLTIEETGGEHDEVKSTLNSKGLKILENDTTELLYVGYDNATEETVVRTKNLSVNKYFNMGTYSRFEDYTDENYNSGTGCFWID